MPPSIIYMLHLPPQLPLEFLVTFARFEFALKRTGYCLGDEHGVKANWDVYVNDLNDAGDEVLTLVYEQSAYLVNHPPLKQVKIEGQLDWAPRVPERSRIRAILLDVRTVRNNLFHGGKFPNKSIEDPSRDQQLIQCCLNVLNALVALPIPNGLAQHFTPEG